MIDEPQSPSGAATPSAAKVDARERHPTRRGRVMTWLRNAFSLESGYEPLTEHEIALLDRIAKWVVKRRVTVPAILALETVKPLNYVGSQAMTFLEPMVRALFTATQYQEVQRILERRQSIEVLLSRIEAAESEKQA